MTTTPIQPFNTPRETSEDQSAFALGNILSAADSSDYGANLPLWFQSQGFENIPLPVETGQMSRGSEGSSSGPRASTGRVSNGGSWRADAISSVAVDAAGDSSPPSAAASMTNDSPIPAAPVITSETVGAGNVVTIAGTSEANDSIRVYDGTALLGETTANASGAWSFVAGSLAAGQHDITATATDQAGATSPHSPDPVVTIPAAPVILSASPDSGPSSALTTTSNQLTLVGTAAAGATITVFDGSTDLGTATTNASGVWTFTTSIPADGRGPQLHRDGDQRVGRSKLGVCGVGDHGQPRHRLVLRLDRPMVEPDHGRRRALLRGKRQCQRQCALGDFRTQ